MTITEDPIPVRISAALIVIPNHLLPEEYHLDRLHECTLGQRMLHGTPSIRPPLRPWDRDRSWKHPMMSKIKWWHLGLMPNLEKEWSHFHDKDWERTSLISSIFHSSYAYQYLGQENLCGFLEFFRIVIYLKGCGSGQFRIKWTENLEYYVVPWQGKSVTWLGSCASDRIWLGVLYWVWQVM